MATTSSNGQKTWLAPVITVVPANAAQNGDAVGNYDTVPHSSGHYHFPS